MGGISSGVGLISGIDTATLIEQLIAIESRPKLYAQNRLTELKAQQAAFLGFNSVLLSLKTSAEAFRKNKIFQSAKATSSDTSVLTASASTNAQPGTYQFLVDQLVSSSQKISRGFADADVSALGGSQISFEFGKGRVESDIALSDLNGGDGVARGKIKITDSAGSSATVDLSRAVTIQDVIDEINATTSVKVTASISGDGLTITDSAGGGGELVIADEVGYSTATELGIAAADSDDGSADGVITGSQINSLSGDTALKNLNDGNGVYINSGLGVADFRIQTRDGVVHDIVLGKRSDGDSGTEPAVTTIQGVIDRINEISAGSVTAEVAADGISLKLTDNTGGSSTTFELQAGVNGDQTIKDLGLDVTPGTTEINGSRVITSINSVLVKSLNGGSGLSGATTLDITDRNSGTTSIDVSSATSLHEIIDLINNDANVDVTATLNANGTGIKITDNTGGSGNLIITNDAATALGIDTGGSGVAADEVNGGNLQFKYVAASTLLSDLNYGRGIGDGSFRITDGNGTTDEVTIDDNVRTLQDLISKINSRATEVQARINDTGDGIVLESTSSNPTTAIKIESLSGSAAKDLNILGEASGSDLSENYIDGSYERKIALESTDTLNDVIRKINEEGIPVAATLVNDGGTNPYRISLTSEISGSSGDLIIETQGLDLGLSTLIEARDSVVFFGSDDPAKGILITSTTNSLDNVIAGVSIDLLGTSDDIVQLTVSRDTQKMVDSVNKFVADFNRAIDRIASLDKYDAETEESGVLLGDPTIARIRSQLYRVVQGEAFGLDSQFTRLVEVGIHVGEGGKLEFDEDRFRQVLQEDPEAVQALFSARDLAEDQNLDLGGGASTESSEPIFDSLGVAERLSELLADLTNSADGTLTLVGRNYDSMISLQEKRIESFDKQLDNRRIQLQRQFAAMESSLALLQGQQSALSSFKPLF